MIIGVHCDGRRGYVPALRHAEALGCGAMQMFSYRRHHEPSEEEFSEFRQAFHKSSLLHLVLHVRYLPLLACEDAGGRQRSIQLLERELRLASKLGGDWLVLHMGAYSPGSTPERGRRLFAQGVRLAVESSGATISLLIENVPGGGRRMGGSLEELSSLLEALDCLSVGAKVCLDTAHAWAYGYDVGSREGMSAFLERATHLFGAERIPIFHLNDSRALQGSHREDHWHWGQGRLGSGGVRLLLEQDLFNKAVAILETPPGPGFDEKNLQWISKFLG